VNFSCILPICNEISNVKSSNKSTANLNNYTGPSFGESMREIARSANMQIANGHTASLLQFSKQKEEFDEPFSFLKAEEEIAEEYVGRIRKLLGKLNK